MKQLIFATHNPNKTAEVKAMLPDYQVQSLAEVGYNTTIAETGTTLKENALLKAQTIYEVFQTPVFADDTGLEVASLDGAPGVYSARYAGDDVTPRENVAKLLREMQGFTNREARFRTVIAYVDENGGQHFFEGAVNGRILEERSGGEGFGYDPVFQPEGYEKSFAAMPAGQKNSISHRGRALQKFAEFMNPPAQKS